MVGVDVIITTEKLHAEALGTTGTNYELRPKPIGTDINVFEVTHHAGRFWAHQPIHERSQHAFRRLRSGGTIALDERNDTILAALARVTLLHAPLR